MWTGRQYMTIDVEIRVKLQRKKETNHERELCKTEVLQNLVYVLG